MEELFENCTKKQGQEIERLRQEYKEQPERLALTTAVSRLGGTKVEIARSFVVSSFFNTPVSKS